MDYLILIYCVLFVILNRLNLKSAILLLIFMLPSYLIRFQIFGFPTTILEISILITFLNWLFNNRRALFKNIFKKTREEKQAYPFAWEMILVLVISFAAVFVGGLTWPALGIFKAYFFEPLLVFILILNNFRGESGARSVILMLSLSSLLVSLMAIWQKASGQFIFNEFWAQAASRRVVSVYGYPNALALMVGPMIPLMLSELIRYCKSQKQLKGWFYLILYSVCLLGGLSAIYFTKSKGALIALIIVSLLAIYLKLKTKFKLILLSLLVLIVPPLVYWQKDWINLKLSANLSWQIRQLQWQETMEMLNDGNFFWGSGLANYQNKIKNYHQEGFFFNREAEADFRLKVVFGEDQSYREVRWQPLEIYLYPHNIFLNFWTEIGLAGALLFSFIIIKFLWLAWKYYRTNRANSNGGLGLALFFSMMIVLIHGLVDVPYFKNDLSVLFWTLVALLSMLKIARIPTKYYGKNKLN